MTIPFYLVTFNRLLGLNSALEFSQRSTLDIDLIIVDMGSTWDPFLKRLNEISNKKYFIQNIGPRNLWKNSFLKEEGVGPFFLSDGDIDYSNIPNDAFRKLTEISHLYPWIPKVGLALSTKKIPFDSEGVRVRQWAKYDQKIQILDDLYLSSLDTTVAFYPERNPTFYFRPALRLGGIYTVEHYPWYERSYNMYPETTFYQSNANEFISSSRQKIKKRSKEKLTSKIIFILFYLLHNCIKKKRFGSFVVKLLSFRAKL